MSRPMTRAEAIAWLEAHGHSPEPYTVLGVCGPVYVDPVEELTGRPYHEAWLPTLGLFQISSTLRSDFPSVEYGPPAFDSYLRTRGPLNARRNGQPAKVLRSGYSVAEMALAFAKRYGLSTASGLKP